MKHTELQNLLKLLIQFTSEKGLNEEPLSEVFNLIEYEIKTLSDKA